ncbi:MAG TPA: citrate synthase [Verrucomicrobiae bacterium]|nr:citrate synthase [Verrucomicrobiae bacterium]
MNTAGTSANGLEGVVAADTRLSDVRGEEGVLIYAGYNINELAGQTCFEEMVHLLHENRLPTRDELSVLKRQLAGYRALPGKIIDLLRALPAETPPMHVLRTGVSALGCFDPEAEDTSEESQKRKALKLIAQLPILTASFHRFRCGKSVSESDPSLGEAANFLYLLDGEKPSREKEDTLDLCYVLHADHGMNASTFSARVTIATLSDIYSAVTTAIGTLKGPLHGGANEGVIKMLREIGTPDKVDAYIQNALAHKQKIMGIGHRVYKTLDPRAPHLRDMAQKLSAKIGEAKWIQMSDRIAKLMFEQKHLNANVDFYSATVYYSLGLPTDLFTPVFAIARTAGWTAHILEQLAHNRLIRPQSHYTGPVGLKVAPIDQRSR